MVWMTVGYKDAAEIVGTPADLPGRFQDGLGAARSTSSPESSITKAFTAPIDME